MPLVTKFKIERGTTVDDVIITDTTGDYNATTNVGGYGTPNEERNTLAVIPIVIKKNREDKNDTVEVSFSSYAAADSIFRYQLKTSGWYEIRVCTLPFTTSGATFTANQYAWNTTSNRVQKYNATTVLFEDVEYIDYDDLLSTNTTSFTVDHLLFDTHVRKLYHDTMAKLLRAMDDNEGKVVIRELREEAEYYLSKHEAAILYFKQGNKDQAREAIDFIDYYKNHKVYN